MRRACAGCRALQVSVKGASGSVYLLCLSGYHPDARTGRANQARLRREWGRVSSLRASMAAFISSQRVHLSLRKRAYLRCAVPCRLP